MHGPQVERIAVDVGQLDVGHHCGGECPAAALGAECPDAGLVVKRTAGGGAGIVPVSAFTNTDNHVVTFNEGLNIYSWPFGVAATLDDITSAIDGGPFGDPVFDVVFVESGGVITQYKYNPNLNSWATLADVPVVGGTIQIGAGTAFLVNRPAGVGSTDLSIALPITD